MRKKLVEVFPRTSRQVVKAKDRISTINKDPCKPASYKAGHSRYEDGARFNQSDRPLPFVRKLSRQSLPDSAMTSVCKPSPLDSREFDEGSLRPSLRSCVSCVFVNHCMVFFDPRLFLGGSPILLIRTESHRARLGRLLRILAIVPAAQSRRLRLWRIEPAFD
ncbi:hypothetical protein [Mesorhizobium sp. B2-4-6]|uniref:hypothetical protein n=1 Tax=Mesorhizobium sp. B2-4-6 TaxID=2589943 RepID=UPI001FEF6BE9|nr:hypothetical protein [Mesorhizobium sp. B2-4-6]